MANNVNNRDMRLRAFMEEYTLLLQVFDDVSNIKKLLASIEFLCIILVTEILCIFVIVVLGLFCWKYCCTTDPEPPPVHNYAPKPAKFKHYQQTTPPTVETAILNNQNIEREKEKSSSALDNIPTIIYETTA